MAASLSLFLETLKRDCKFGGVRQFQSNLQSMFAHRFRYGGGKMLNESSAVSEAQQNLIMKHADTRTCLNHYLPRTSTPICRAL